jgi:hypothetical protein
MRHDAEEREVIYVEREGGSVLGPLLFGLVVGAGLAILFAPQSGEETRRALRGRLRQLRDFAEEEIDELKERFSDTEPEPEPEPVHRRGNRGEPKPPPASLSPREELERRLANARARRRGGSPPPPEDEEPLA